MIDNIEYIKDLLKFESEDDFYYLQILMRKKENPQLGSNSMVIKNYYIKSVSHLYTVYDEIKNLCNIFNARAMLRLNKRSFYKVGFKTMVNISNTMMNKDFTHIRNQYDRACGQGNSDKNRTWIIDIDFNDGLRLENINGTKVENILIALNKCTPTGDKKVVILESRQGCHLIVRPFNVMEFKDAGYEEDIHKDNPTNLYIP